MKKSIVAALLIHLFCLPPASPGQGSESVSSERAKIVAAAKDVMHKARYCALVTIGDDRYAQARVVDPLAPEEDLTIWIATNPVTRKVGQIRKNPRVTLFYFDSVGLGYVTVLGEAELINLSSEKAKHWKEDWTPFYKNKNRGTDFLLIRVRPRRLEVISFAHGITGDPKTWRPATIDLRW